MARPLAPLFDLLDDEIKQTDVFRQALIHRSASAGNNYEVLEFLGDSALGLVISEALLQRMDNPTEGELSRMRSALVRGSTLAAIGEENGLGQHLVLGSGEMKSGGERRNSILEDAVEAIFGAVFLIKGFDYTSAYIRQVFAERLSNLPGLETLKDPKTRLQEWLQSRNTPLPIYALEAESGKDHERIFVSSCYVESFDYKTDAESSSRRKAEQGAAAEMLSKIFANDK